MAVLLGSREGARQRGLTAKEIIGANAGRATSVANRTGRSNARRQHLLGRGIESVVALEN